MSVTRLCLRSGERLVAQNEQVVVATTPAGPPTHSPACAPVGAGSGWSARVSRRGTIVAAVTTAGLARTDLAAGAAVGPPVPYPGTAGWRLLVDGTILTATAGGPFVRHAPDGTATVVLESAPPGWMAVDEVRRTVTFVPQSGDPVVVPLP